MDNYELIHSGIKGMKWGVRRYQNKDVSLTPAGRKRYNSEMGKLRAEEKTIKNKLATRSKMAKLDAKKNSVEALRKQLDDPDESIKKKSVKEMTDEELSSAVRRAELEQRYNTLHPKHFSAGEKFIKEAVGPALTSSAKSLMTEYLTKKGKEYLGLKDEPDAVEVLKREFNKLNYQKQIRDLKNTSYQKTKRDLELEKLRVDNEKIKADTEKTRLENESKRKKDEEDN